jgi:hypothetical protein
VVELLVSAAVVCVLAALMSLPRLMGGWALFKVGAAMVAVGLGVGIPAGACYHWLLMRHVRPLPRGWWINPTQCHPLLPGPAQGPVRRWFVTGAVAWVVAVLGCVLAFLGGVAL